MTEDPDERTRQYAELIRKLFEEAIQKGEILPAEINIIIAKTEFPKDMTTPIPPENTEQDIREPVSERHEHGDVVNITADLSGSDPEDIRYAIHRKVLYLTAYAHGIIYRAAYPVEDARSETLTHTFRNGVIEFTYKKQGPVSE